MKATRIILAAAAAAFIAAPAFAADAAKSDAPAMTKNQVTEWTKLDADKDGKLSKEEFVSRKSAKHKEVAKKEAAPAASETKEETPATTAPAAGGSETPAKE